VAMAPSGEVHVIQTAQSDIERLAPRAPFVLGLLVVALYVLPYIVLGQDSHIAVFDTLDSVLPCYKFLAESGKIFAPNLTPLPGMMDGVPRISMPSEFNPLVWLFYFLGPYGGYVANTALLRIVAYVGMYLLLTRHVLKMGANSLLAVGTALCFALLPFWDFGGLSVAGQPLIVYALLGVREGDYRWRNWSVLALVPFYSFFVVSTIFLLACMGGLFVVDAIRERRANWAFAAALALIAAASVVAEYRLFYGMLVGSGFVSHRSEFDVPTVGLLQMFDEVKINFLVGQVHVPTCHLPFVLVAIAAAILAMFARRSIDKLFVGIMAGIIVISFWYGLCEWEGFHYLIDRSTFLRQFQMSRFHWLHPALWYVAFALALRALLPLRFGRTLVMGLLVCQVVFLCFVSELSERARHHGPSFREFFSPSLFDEISTYIKEDKQRCRVAAIGFYPSILSYNGFNTLDAYLGNYPLEYKHRFRHIIAQELAKNESIRRYYDGWGSRCYIFTDELGVKFDFTKDSGRTIRHLQLDTQAFSDLGGKYLLSAVPILNAKDNQLALERTFERNDSPWRIYLYKVVR
jgi:hypothetical protein